MNHRAFISQIRANMHTLSSVSVPAIIIALVLLGASFFFPAAAERLRFLFVLIVAAVSLFWIFLGVRTYLYSVRAEKEG